MSLLFAVSSCPRGSEDRVLGLPLHEARMLSKQPSPRRLLRSRFPMSALQRGSATVPMGLEICLLPSGDHSSNTLCTPGIKSIDKSSYSRICEVCVSRYTPVPTETNQKKAKKAGDPRPWCFPARGNQLINYSSLQLLRTWSLGYR